MNKAPSIDTYIEQYLGDTLKRLKVIRALVKKHAPKATELISYGIPAFKMNGKILLYFAAFERHIGLYPLTLAIKRFKDDLKDYKTGKGSIQFSNNEKFPVKLIEKNNCI